MSSSEQQKLDAIAVRHDTHADFDGVIAHFTGLLVSQNITGGRVLEAGCSTGAMTGMLLERADKLDVVEGSPHYAEIVRARYPNRVAMHVALFEDFSPTNPYDAVIAANVLHHMADAMATVRRFADWLKPGGSLHLSVPNMTSFHRELGVAMGVAQAVHDTSERNRFFQQPGRFTREKLEHVVRTAGLEIAHSEGFFFKPFPHEIMNRTTLSPEVLRGLFLMGRRYPALACQLYVRATKPLSP